MRQAARLYMDCLEEQLMGVDGVREIVTGLATLNVQRIAKRTETNVKAVNQKLDVLGQDVNDGFAQTMELIRGGAPKAMHDLLKQAEFMNPGLNIKAEINAASRQISVSGKPGVEGVSLGTLRFSGEEQLTKGLPKFQRAFDKGFPAVFEPGECEWESHVILPEALDFKSEELFFTFTPSVPQQVIPVRLEARGKDGAVLTIDYAESTCLRKGRREIELQIGGGQLAGHFNLVLRQEESAKLGLTVQLDALSPDKVLHTISFVETLQSGAELFVIPLDDGPFEMNGQVKGDFPDFSDHKMLLDWLDIINKTYGKQFEFSPDIEEEDWNRIRLLATLIEDRTIKFRSEGTAIFDVEREIGFRLLDGLIEGKSDFNNLSISYDFPQMAFAGGTVDLPLLLMVYDEPSLNEDPDELRARLEQLDNKSMTTFKIGYGAHYITLEPRDFRSLSRTD